MLAGVRVLEMTDEHTAHAGRLLAHLGADVVAVEPAEGSALRRRPPFLDDREGCERSLRWWESAAGKRSVVVDIAEEGGRDTLRGLIRRSDVVLEGPGSSLDGAGIGWDSLAGEGRRPVWVSVTPFGRGSPRADQPVTDLTLLAGGGPLWNCGYDDHSIPPVRGAGQQAHRIGAWFAVMGALVGLRHRMHGDGQLVDVNVDAACNVTSEHVTYNWLLIEEECFRQTGRHAYYTPTAPVQVRCADGRHVTTGVLPRTPAEFGALHEWLTELVLLDGFPEAVFLEMAAERDQPVEAAGIGADDEATAILAAARAAITLIAGHLPAAEFFVESQRRGFPTGAILAPDEAFDDPHVAERGFVVDVEHPELGRTIRHPGSPITASALEQLRHRRPPHLGEHTEEVRAEWGPSEERTS